MSDNGNFKQAFNIIRHRGRATEATHPSGTKFYRQDKIYIPEFDGFVPCMDDDDHFIFETPKTWKGQSSFQCTCGSIGIIIGSLTYEKHTSPQGMLLACHYYMTFGHHSNQHTW